jgi:site-specific DNA-methyltransferase (adenine-specific)
MINLILGDCLEKMKEIEDNSIDAVITDLPYQVTNNKWDVIIPFNKIWHELNRISKVDSPIILFGSGMFTSDLMKSNVKNWRYNLIWIKDKPVGFLNANKMPLRCHEDIVIFYKKLPTYNPQKWYSKVMNTVYISGGSQALDSNNYGQYETIKSKDLNSTERMPLSYLSCNSVNGQSKDKHHPTQKPVALMEYLIKTYTNEGDTVLDFTMGSGTTGVACKKLKRNFIGIEKDEKYFEIAKKRIEEEPELLFY